MSIDIERLKARNFSGLTDEEFKRFTTAVQYRVGGGKRSYVLCLMCKHFTKIHEDSVAKQAQLDDRVGFAIDGVYESILGKPENPEATHPYYRKEVNHGRL